MWTILTIAAAILGVIVVVKLVSDAVNYRRILEARKRVDDLLQ